MSNTDHPNMLRLEQTRNGHECKSPPPTVGVLLGLLTMRNKIGSARRDAQHKTWISASWRTSKKTSWSYFYVCGRSNSYHGPLDKLVNGTVTLSRADESYEFLFVRVLEMIRWALNQVNFRVLVKADDDSYVHVRNTLALVDRKSMKSPSLVKWLYAGQMARRGVVLRPNVTLESISSNSKDREYFSKLPEKTWRAWIVPYEALPDSKCVKHDGVYYHQPYNIGLGYMLGNVGARAILRRHDARRGTERRLTYRNYPEDAYVGILAREVGLKGSTVLAHDSFSSDYLSCSLLRRFGLANDRWVFYHRLRIKTAMTDFMTLRNCGRRSAGRGANLSLN